MLLISREVVDIFVDGNKSDSVAKLDYKVLLSLHRLTVCWLKCHLTIHVFQQRLQQLQQIHLIKVARLGFLGATPLKFEN